MDRSRAGALGLVVGVAGSLITVIGFAPHFDRIDAGQPELATVLIVVICGGLVVTGLGLLGSGAYRWYRRVPAGTPVVFSVTGILGSFLVFQPGAYDGLAGTFRAIVFLLFFFVGSGLSWGAVYWSRRDDIHSQLAVLLSILGIGLFYVIHRSLDLHLPHLVIILVVFLLAVVPTFAVHLQRRSHVLDR